MRKKIIKTNKAKYSQLSQLGTRYDLSFSSHVSLGNKIIALDGRKRKILVLDCSNVENMHYIIDLNDMKAISIKKNYRGIRPGELEKRDFDEFLDSIFLQFEYKEDEKTFAIPFYELGRNNFNELPMLERNARNWQIILSKLIAPKTLQTVRDKLLAHSY